MNLLAQALILDTETLGLRRGSGLHELAIYDLETRRVHEYILEPNLVIAGAATSQEGTRLATHPLDTHERVKGLKSWRQAIVQQIFVEQGISFPEHDYLEALRNYNRFTYRQIQKGLAPHLRGEQETTSALDARRARMSARGAELRTIGTQISVENLLEGELRRRIKAGSTIWIANAAFESKQIGAQFAADGGGGWLRNMLETSGTSPDMLYVTGQEVNDARTVALATDDWRNVYRAYARYTPAAGEVAVRDILDLTRAFHSYGKHLGIYNGGNTGLAVDIQSMLQDVTAGRAIQRELHRAAEDTALHEAPLLQRMVAMNEALDAVERRTPEGLRLLEQARRGQGAFASASRYFAALQYIQPQLENASVIRRLSRAQQDIATQGYTYVQTGIERFVTEKQSKPDGTEVEMRRGMYGRRRIESLEETLEHLRTGGYSINLDEQYERFVREAGETVPDILAYEERAVQRELDKAASALKNAPVGNARLQSAIRRLQGDSFADMAIRATSGLRGRSGALVGALGIVAGVGAAAATASTPVEPAGSVVDYNYQDWLREQERLDHQGIAGSRRALNTDFGSPYQGPATAFGVLADQDFLRERERYLRSQYNISHYDPQRGVFGVLGPFSYARKGYQYLQGGTPIEAFGSLRGENLMAFNLRSGGWKMHVQDADTIVVKRGGVSGAVRDFFGLNRGFAFRLAGVDAPETAHGENPAQPHAYIATAALQRMMASADDLTLVYDPTNISYGRMMGALVADGKNLNFELVKRGHAAYLPYGKSEESMIDYQALRLAEAGAYKANRGFWSHPWAQAYRAAADAGMGRVTFNQLANSQSIVANTGRMALVSLANAAERDGQWNERYSNLATEIGSTYNSRESVEPIVWEDPGGSTGVFLQEQLQDLAGYIRTSGTGNQPYKHSHRTGYGKYNKKLALDTAGNTTSSWSKRRLRAFDLYGSHKEQALERKRRQAAAQRNVNQIIFDSAINHHRM